MAPPFKAVPGATGPPSCPPAGPPRPGDTGHRHGSTPQESAALPHRAPWARVRGCGFHTIPRTTLVTQAWSEVASAAREPGLEFYSKKIPTSLGAGSSLARKSHTPCHGPLSPLPATGPVPFACHVPRPLCLPCSCGTRRQQPTFTVGRHSLVRYVGNSFSEPT